MDLAPWDNLQESEDVIIVEDENMPGLIDALYISVRNQSTVIRANNPGGAQPYVARQGASSRPTTTSADQERLSQNVGICEWVEIALVDVGDTSDTITKLQDGPELPQRIRVLLVSFRPNTLRMHLTD